MKKIFVLTLSVLMACVFSMTIYAGEWKTGKDGWWWQNEDGSYPVSKWEWLDGNDDGISECYYFNEWGYLITNTHTPDGYYVNENGAWVGVGGVVQTKGTKKRKSILGDWEYFPEYGEGSWVKIKPYNDLYYEIDIEAQTSWGTGAYTKFRSAFIDGWFLMPDYPNAKPIGVENYQGDRYVIIDDFGIGIQGYLYYDGEKIRIQGIKVSSYSDPDIDSKRLFNSTYKRK